MSRPKPKSKTGGPVFIAHGYSLSPTVREKLIELLCCDINDKDFDSALVIMNIESWLGAYPQLVQSLDNAPRPSDYIAIYKNIQKETVRLLNALSDMSMFYREQFDLEKQSLTLNEVEQVVASIYEVSNSVIKNYKEMPTKGAPRNTALTTVIFQLRSSFSKYYSGQTGGQEKQGAFKKKSFREMNEILFIEAALLDARIIPKRNSYKTVERLLKDKRCIFA